MKKIFIISIFFIELCFLFSCQKDIINNITNNIINNHLEVDDIIKLETIEDVLCTTIENVKSTVIGVSAKNSTAFVSSSSTGSAVIVKKEATTYYAVTSRHVIMNSKYNIYDQIMVYIGDVDIYLKASIISYDTAIDIALLSFQTELELPIAIISDSENIKVGRYTISIGNPYDLELYYNTVNIGHISSINRVIKENDIYGHSINNLYFQHNSLINSGDSGGGVFDIYGYLLGINDWKLIDKGVSIEGMGFAVPISEVLKSFNQYL